MDEELRAEEPEHEPVTTDAADQVRRRAAAGVQPGRMPAIYLGHGAPPLVDDPLWVVQLEAWASALPRPRAVLMVSAHWESAPLTIGATDDGVPLVYDFGGFPERYYRARYPAPGAPGLAAQVRGLLAGQEPVTDLPGRGLDHGAYVPLTVMYPDADIPVLQISMPSLEPERLLRIGQALRPLRDEGVLIVGSGFLTHNLRAADWSPHPVTPAWAVEFDAWAGDVLARRDMDSLLDYRRLAPGVRTALPTHEHFVPVIAALGAAVDGPNQVQFPITGFIAGSLTRRSVQYG